VIHPPIDFDPTSFRLHAAACSRRSPLSAAAATLAGRLVVLC